MNLTLGRWDLHLVFNDDSNTIKLFDYRGKMVYHAECQNATVNPGFFKNGRCPRGQFAVGRPSKVKHKAYGYWFIPLYDFDKNQEMKRFKRRGIGIHGGGSVLKDPFAPRQGWYKTHGCLRMQNEDLDILVPHLKLTLDAGGKVFLTVFGSQVDNKA